MIEFNVLLVGPGFYLVTAIINGGEPVQVGLFDSIEEIDDACIKFSDEHRRLHLH